MNEWWRTPADAEPVQESAPVPAAPASNDQWWTSAPVADDAPKPATPAAPAASQNWWADSPVDETPQPGKAIDPNGLAGAGLPPVRPKGLGHNTPLDTGLNVPETPQTQAAQQQAVAEGRRPAAMFPKGSREPALPPGMARMETARGVFHFDPMTTSPDYLRRMSRLGRENEALGLGPYSKPDVQKRIDQGEPPLAVTERQPDGTEVKAAVGTPSTAPEQQAAIAAGAAPGNGVGVEPLEGVVNGRFPNGVPAPPVRPAGLGAPKPQPMGPPIPTPDPGNMLDDPGKFRDRTGSQDQMLTGEQAYNERAGALKAAESELDFHRQRYLAAKQRADAIQNAPVGRRGSGTEQQRQIILDELKSAQTAVQESTRDLGALKRAPLPRMEAGRSSGEAVGRAFVNFIPKSIEGLALYAEGITGKSLGSRSLRDFQDAVDEKLQGDPARREEFLDKMGSGAGSALGFMLGGSAARLAGVPQKIASGTLGGSGQAADYYREAESKGKKGFDLAVAYATGGAIGATEMFGIGSTLERMDKATAGGVRRYFGLMLREGGEEAVQEATQQLLENMAKYGLYGEDVPLTKDVAENALIGALLGVGMAGATGVGTLSSRNRLSRAEREINAASGVKSAPEEISASLKAAGEAQQRQTPGLPAPDQQSAPAAAEQPASPPTQPQEQTPASAAPTPAQNGDINQQQPQQADAQPAQENKLENSDNFQQNFSNPPTDTPETRTLRVAGWADEDIADLSPRQMQQAMKDAENAGFTDPGSSAENPSGKTPDGSPPISEPASDAGTRAKPVTVTEQQDIAPAAAQVNTEPTEAQKAAGNYKLGHARYDGMDLSIETPKGATRTGTDPDGEKWSVQMPAAYGYIKGSTGADGDKVDVFVGDGAPNGKVFVIDQYDPKTGKFDEHKAIVGVSTEEEAAALYHQAYPGGPKSRLGGITELTTQEFKARLAKGQLKKAFAPKPTTSTENVGVSENISDNPDKSGQLAILSDVRPDATATPDPQTQAVSSAIRQSLEKLKVPTDSIPNDLLDLTAKKMLEGMKIGDAMLAAATELTSNQDQNYDTALDVKAKEAEADAAEAAANAKPKGGKKDATTKGTRGTKTQPADAGTVTAEAGTATGPGTGQSQSGDTATGTTEGSDQAPAGTRDEGNRPAGEGTVSENGAKPAGDGQGQQGGKDSQAGTAEGSKDNSEVGPTPKGVEEDGDEGDNRLGHMVNKLGSNLKAIKSGGMLRAGFATEFLQENKLATGSKKNWDTGQGLKLTPLGETVAADWKGYGVVPGPKIVEYAKAWIESVEGPAKTPAEIESQAAHDLKVAIEAIYGARQLISGREKPAQNGISAKVQLEQAPKTIARYTEVLLEAQQTIRENFGEQKLREMMREARKEAIFSRRALASKKPKPAEEKPESGPKVEDAGEKIGGARKDNWRGKGMSQEEFDKLSGAERAKFVTKENVWPRPNYEAWADEDGVEPKAVYLAKILYDRIAVQPRDDAEQFYLETVGKVRKIVEAIKTEKDAKDADSAFRSLFEKEENGRLRTTEDFYNAKTALGRPMARGRTRPYSLWLTSKDFWAAEKAIKEGWPGAAPWTRKYAVREWSKIDGKVVWRVVQKKTYSPVGSDLYDTKAEAEAAAEAIYTQSLQEKTKDQLPDRPHLDNIERKGPDYRKGQNVSGDDFIKTFGFRGVEFGNWVANDERQKTVNLAFDALHDLARVLGISPKAISLNGTLAVGFGSRGRGGRAAAHYEPHLLVINMTKLSGAGSLAHEWGHAFDHYMGELNQSKPYAGAPNSITGWDKVGEKPINWHNLSHRTAQALRRLIAAIHNRPETNVEMQARMQARIDRDERILKSWADARDRYKKEWETAGPERRRQLEREGKKAQAVLDKHMPSLLRLKEAAKNPTEKNRLRNAITNYYREAQKLSGTGDYWHRPNELFARAFETYVFDKIAGEGNSSQYLVQGVEDGRYSTGYKGNPYPAGDERKAINKAFDDLMNRIEAADGKAGAASKLQDSKGAPDLESETVDYSAPVEFESGPVSDESMDEGDAQTSDDLDGETAGAATASANVSESSDNAPDHVKAFKARLLRADGGFGNILEARKFAREHGFKAKEDRPEAKQIEEAIEHAIALAAREIISTAESPQAAYKALVALYERQPNLANRTSQSIAEQAYSTPIPLAYVASRLAGIDTEAKVYEPTAGNGLLLIETDPAKTRANEINDERRGILEAQGYDTTGQDATNPGVVPNKSFDVVIGNPPFGAVKDGGTSKQWTVGTFETTQIDHAIVMQSLAAMKDTGRAVLIIGGINAETDKDRALGYTAKSKRVFYRELMKSYNVVDHFTVSGDLYKKQGAGWPVDIIVIEGRTPSTREGPSNPKSLPKLLKSWDEVGAKLNGLTGRSDPAINNPAETGTGPAGISGSGVATDDGAGSAGKPGNGQNAGTGSAGADTGQSNPQGTAPNGGRTGGAVDGNGGRTDNGAAADTGEIRPGDFENALDALLGSESPAPQGGVSDSKPTRKPRAPRTPAKAAGEAVTEVVKGIDAALSGLDALFNDPNKFGSGPSFDEETYKKAKPFFAAAMEHFKNAVASAREAMQLLMKELIDKKNWGREQLMRLQPYIERFATEWVAKPAPAPAPAPQQQEGPAADDLQAPYQPASKHGASLPGIYVPTTLRDPTTKALADLERRVGPIDQFVADELGFNIDKSFHQSFSQAQVDALGLAIDNAKKGKGFVLGDQTGIGKGRVVAGMIVWANKQGLLPVFVTEKPDLYGDMWRDLTDIQYPQRLNRELDIFMTNSGQAVPLDDTAVEWKSEADDAAENGEPIPPKRGRFSTVQTVDQSTARMKDVLAGSYKPDVLFTSYDQMNSQEGAETARRRFLRQIAPRAFVILDESHNAGGQALTRTKKDKAPPRSVVFREAVGNAAGVMYSSATFAKSPDVMDLYATTDMSLAVENPKAIGPLIKKGGVPLQQAVATMLVKAGQYIRRERTFEGVDYDSEVVPINEQSYANFSRALKSIFQFDLAFADERQQIMEQYITEGNFGSTRDNAVGEIAANSTEFSSIMHNVINQMILSIKADAAADRAIKALEEGHKPIIALSATMEAFLTDFVDGTGLKVGDIINLDFSAVLDRYLERTRRFTIKDEGELKQHVFIKDKDMSPAALAQFKQVKAQIAEYDFSELPISPIDHIRGRLAKAGYSVKEVTGRTTTIDYTGNDPVLSKRPPKEIGAGGKRVSIREFNDGKLHLIILNRSGSTGVSLHANPKYKDVRRRVMILLQSDPNPDVMMQMLGRPHRTGQVVPPIYVDLQADIPAEVRPAAVRMKKLASLNANTTASRRSKFSGDSPDFINEYGDAVVAAVLREDMQTLIDLGSPIDPFQSNRTGFAAKVTGRLTLLLPEEQQRLIDTIVDSYNALIQHLDEVGENQLEAKYIDLQAELRPDSVRVLKASTGPSPFQAETRFEMYSVKSSGRSMSADEVVEAVAESLKTEVPQNEKFHQALTQLRNNKGTEERHARIKRAVERGNDYSKEYIKIFDKPEAKTREAEKLRETARQFVALANEFTVGDYVKYDPGDGTQTTAIVLSVKSKDKGVKNPLSLSNWMLTIAIPDGRRTMGIPFSQIAVPGVPSPTQMAEKESKAVIIRDGSGSVLQMQGLFDAARKTSREDRWFITGNLLTGYDLGKGSGQIVTFSKADGTVDNGILMPRKFNPESFMAERPVRFQTGEQVLKFIDKVNDAEAASTDTIIVVRKDSSWRGGYEFDLPASKGRGGKYFADDTVRAIYDRWEKRGSRMRAQVDRNVASRLIDAMLKLDAVFETTSNQDIASQIIQESQPQQPPAPRAQAIPSARPRLTQQAIAAGLDEAHIVNVVTDIVDKVVGPGRVKVSAAQSLTYGEGGIAAGLFISASTAIQISTQSQDKRVTGYHEAFHALQTFGVFSPQEIAILHAEAPRHRAIIQGMYGRHQDDGSQVLPDSELPTGETSAHAFGHYAAARDAGRHPYGMKIGIRNLFERMYAIMRRIRAWAAGLGFQTSEDIFERARTGQYANIQNDGLSWDQDGLRAELWNEDPKGNKISPRAMAMPPRQKQDPRGRGRVARAISGFIRTQADNVVALRELQRKFVADSGITQFPDAHAAYGAFGSRMAESIKTAERDEFAPLNAKVALAGGAERFGRYVFLRHAKARNDYIASKNPQMPDGGSGISTTDAQNELAQDFLNAPDITQLNDAAAELYDLLDRNRDRMVLAGLITQAKADAWRNQYPDGTYVPLRWFENDEMLVTAGMGGGTKMSLMGRPLEKSAMGRVSEADNPLTQSIQMVVQTIHLEERNRVANTLLRFAQLTERHYGAGNGPFRIRRKLPMTRSDSGGVVHDVIDYSYPARDDVVTVKVNGKDVYIEMSSEPGLADALKNAAFHENDIALHYLGQATSIYSRLKTAWNPFFVPKNFYRDVRDARRAVIARLGFRAALTFHRNLSPDRAIAETVRNIVFDARTPQFEEFRENGGKMAFATLRTLDEIRRKIKFDTEGRNTAHAALAGLGHLVEGWNDIAETSVRFALYQTARQNGLSIDQAVQLSLEGTLNFHRRGDSIIARVARAIVPFWGPSIQGPLRAARLIADSGAGRGQRYGRSAALTTGTLARGFMRSYAILLPIGFFVGLWNYLAGGDDDDGIPWWDKAQADTRAKRNTLIYIGKDANGKPMYHNGPAFPEHMIPYQVGMSIARAFFGKQGASKIASDMMGVVKTISPHEGRDFAPGIVQPFTEIANNEDFAGNRIHKSWGKRGVDKWMNGFDDTAHGWVSAAKWLNIIGVNIHPEDVRHLVRSYVGGTYGFMEWSADKAGIGPAGDPRLPPVVRDFVAVDPHQRFERKRIEEMRGQSNNAVALSKKNSVNEPNVFNGPKGGKRTAYGDVLQEMDEVLRPLRQALSKAKIDRNVAEAERLQTQIANTQKRYRIQAERARGNAAQ